MAHAFAPRPACVVAVRAQKKASLNGAVPEAAPKKLPGLNLGFTADNELFVGRAAMLGFAFSLVGEILTGKGALAQLGYEVFDDKLGILQIDEIVVGVILFNLVAAILPVSGTFVPDEEVDSRPTGALQVRRRSCLDSLRTTAPCCPLTVRLTRCTAAFRVRVPTQDPRVSLLNPKEFFGVSRFGFTKANELFVGRVAQLGFAASLIGETLTGKGALAQFDIETGISLRVRFPWCGTLRTWPCLAPRGAAGAVAVLTAPSLTPPFPRAGH